ncbi:XRE family transcriptional regulator, partial [Legionella pneumophila]
SWLLGISNDPHGEWMDHVIFEY